MNESKTPDELTSTDHAIAAMVNEFLRWPLPESVSSDGCVTRPQLGRTGTNLMSVGEAVQMMQEVVRPHVDELARQLETELNQLAAENRMLKQCNGQLNSMVDELNEARETIRLLNEAQNVTAAKLNNCNLSRDKWRGVAVSLASMVEIAKASGNFRGIVIIGSKGKSFRLWADESLAAFTALQQEESK